MAGPRKRSALISLLVSDQRGGPQAAILDELRRCLLDGGVPPGTAIPLDEVAQVFGVSRIPVREALKTLIGEGLVEHQPNFGYRVAKLTTHELHELYVVREVLEVAALTAAVARATPQDDVEATATHEALGQAIAAHDVRGYHRDSRRFHLALVRPCGMHRLLAMLESAWNTTEPVQPMAHVSDGAKAEMHRDHGEMLAAFLARDVERLLAAAREHHGRLRASLAALPRHTGLFVDSE
ncbi:GntR family transcriptional regulator [Lentzea sp. NPDC005914]|uniref:GntR family transcriptional regulator n=1 Tax=Lentzea sp. NPDC005914 TaxID=3154572 RepID=UPI0033DCDD76